MERKNFIKNEMETNRGGIGRAELARREAVFIGKDPDNGIRMRVVHNTAVFLAQLKDGKEKTTGEHLGRQKIGIGEEIRHDTENGGTITIFGGELVPGRKRSFVFSLPKGYTLTKLIPKESGQ